MTDDVAAAGTRCRSSFSPPCAAAERTLRAAGSPSALRDALTELAAAAVRSRWCDHPAASRSIASPAPRPTRCGQMVYRVLDPAGSCMATGAAPAR